jgi:hypothetical protein
VARSIVSSFLSQVLRGTSVSDVPEDSSFVVRWDPGFPHIRHLHQVCAKASPPPFPHLVPAAFELIHLEFLPSCAILIIKITPIGTVYEKPN